MDESKILDLYGRKKTNEIYNKLLLMTQLSDEEYENILQTAKTIELVDLLKKTQRERILLLNNILFPNSFVFLKEYSTSFWDEKPYEDNSIYSELIKNNNILIEYKFLELSTYKNYYGTGFLEFYNNIKYLKEQKKEESESYNKF